jgi:gamma-glutamylcyclotransferase (GGCT)/AIG2-like uncharacterized protein YtfP
MKTHLFTYGLFRDQAKLLLGQPISCGRAYIKGKMYRVNEFYPGYIDGNGKVWGEVFLIEDEVLPHLDTYEGHEYERIKVKSSSDLECWIYRYKYDVGGFQEIKSGDWHLR